MVNYCQRAEARNEFSVVVKQRACARGTSRGLQKWVRGELQWFCEAGVAQTASLLGEEEVAHVVPRLLGLSGTTGGDTES